MCRPAGCGSSRSVAPISTARSRMPQHAAALAAVAGEAVAVVVDLQPRAAAGELEPHLGARWRRAWRATLVSASWATR